MLPTPTPMLRMKLRLVRDDAQAAVNALAKLAVLHLETVIAPDEEINEWPAAEFQEAFHSLRSRYRKVMAFAHEDIRQDMTGPATEVTLPQLIKADEIMRELWAQVSACEEKTRQLREQAGGTSQLLANLQRFLALDINLERLGRDSRFLKVIVGTITSSNFSHLGRALSLSGYLLEGFYRGEGIDHVLIIGPAERAAEVQELLKSADFREITIPEEFSDHPQTVQQRLLARQRELEQQISAQHEEIQQLIQANRGVLADVGDLLQNAMPYAGVAGSLKGKGSLVLLEGWVPRAQQAEIKASLDQSVERAYLLDFEAPTEEQLEQVPTRLDSSWLIRPFDLLVGQFGLPRYGEIDPGILFAFSYILMFGMMFGDIGHGAVIAGLGVYLWRRYPAFGVVATLAGLSSAFFGFVYGSLFGYEHVIHPLWMSPMEDPQQVLLLALIWGIGFLVIANLLAIRNAWVFGRREQALYSPLGIAGLVFYLSAVAYLVIAYDAPDSDTGSLSTLLAGLLVVSMLIMLLHLWRESQGQLSERILMVVVEGLEIVINNVSATLSFLRVAAFTLNHIALCAAVFALAGMMDTFGHWVTVVLGNLFVIVLEGAIVAIQCLRLEYYEGFSRFFSGRGKPYKPLKIEPV